MQCFPPAISSALILPLCFLPFSSSEHEELYNWDREGEREHALFFYARNFPLFSSSSSNSCSTHEWKNTVRRPPADARVCAYKKESDRLKGSFSPTSSSSLLHARTPLMLGRAPTQCEYQSIPFVRIYPLFSSVALQYSITYMLSRLSLALLVLRTVGFATPLM